MNKILKSALICAAFSTTTTHAAFIDVLWVSGTDTYDTNISTLASGGTKDASTYDPDSNGSLSWNIDFWNDGAVNFNDYDVLVIGSTCLNGTGTYCNDTDGFFGLGVRPQDNVLDYKDEIADARGDRTFVSGQDADWHFINDLGDSDDARAFLINAVNWAASGAGMGIVALTDGHSNGTASATGWISDTNSFLFDELSAARGLGDSEKVIIPDDSASFPINEGLTSDKLSDWSTSSHTYFTKADLDDTKWKSINDYGVLGGPNSVTIVTASEAAGSTDGDPTKVSEPAPLLISSLGLLLIGAFRKRQ